MAAAAAVALAALAGCNSSEPSAPPTSEPALTTATAEPDVVATSEPVVTTEEPSEEPEVGQSEESAEAFVEHYISVLSAIHLRNAEPEDLQALAAPGCKTCAAFVQAAETKRFDHAYVDFMDGRGVLIGEKAYVEAALEQVDDGARVDTVFELKWEGDSWLVSEIRLSAG